MNKVYFHTLGCKVNQYDTQAMLEQFLAKGYSQVFDPKEADVCVINTCTVTATADKKSLQMAHKQKKLNPNCELVMCGCMAQGKAEALKTTGARLIIGTQFRHRVVELLQKAIDEKAQIVAVENLDASPFENLSISAHNAHTRAVIKIQEGCNYNCSYCIIPSVRGKVRSRALADIVEESKHLVAHGHKEIVLTGINLSCYGIDLENANLCDVVDALNAIDGLERIRISSLEPNLVTEDVAKRLSKASKLCPHFHLALQSGSDDVLKKMRRRYLSARFKQSVDILRAYFPNCAITTDIIVGFPFETEENFNETCAFVENIGFQKVHAFPYSPREGTDAATMPQIPNHIKKERVRKLIALSESISQKLLEKALNKVYTVLLEEEVAPNVWFGYTSEYMPVEVQGEWQSSDLIAVKMVAIKNNVLIGENVDYGKLHFL